MIFNPTGWNQNSDPCREEILICVGLFQYIEIPCTVLQGISLRYTGLTVSGIQASDRVPRHGFAWAIVGFLWLAFLLNYVDRQLVFSIFPVLKTEIGFSNAQLGLVGSLFIWTYCLCMAPAGRLGDLVRRERLILLSIVLWSLATAGTGLAGSVAAILFWRAMMGVTESLYAPSAFGLIAMLHPTARSRALAIHGTAQLVGVVLGGWSGGWIAEHVGWRNGFLVLGAFGIAYALVLTPIFRRLPDTRIQRKLQAGRALDIFRSRCYIVLILGFLSLGTMLWMLYAWLPTFIFERYQLGLADSGLIATFYLQSSSAVGVLASGVLADWLVKYTRAARF